MRTHETDTNPLLDYDPSGEQCSACDFVRGLCPYHQGEEDSRAKLVEAIQFMHEDPEQITSVLDVAERARTANLSEPR